MSSSLGFMGSGISGHLIPPPSFESIATVNVTSNTSTITFSSIPSTYKALQLRMLWRSASTGFNQQFVLSLNGDTNVNNYTRHVLQGDGASASAFGNASGTLGGIRSANLASSSDVANLFSPAIIDIQDYNSSSKNKTVRIFGGYDSNNAGGASIFLESGLYISTTAITSLSITDYNAAGSAAGSTFALYGIK